MRTIAFLLLFTTTVWAETPTVTVGPNAPVTPEWLGREMASVPACSAAAASLVPSPHTMVVDVDMSRGAVTKVTIVTSSGNPAFDQKAVQCLQNLPATFTTKIIGDLAMFVPITSNNGAVAPLSDPSASTIALQPARTNAITVQHDIAPAPPTFARAPSSAGYRHSCDENDYPVLALQTLAEGSTLIALAVTAEGNVADVAVQRSSGHTNLDEAAVVCAKHWVYAPATKDGSPIASHRLAIVKWEIRANYPFSVISGAVRSCVMSTESGRKEYVETKPYTVLKMHFSNGAITNANVVGRSGSPDLDRRMLECTRAVPKYMTALVTGEVDETLVNYTNPTQAVTSRAIALSTLACPASYYPPEALRLDESGETTLAFGITANGAVKDVSVEQSSGHKLLDDAAVICAQQTWHYMPAFQNSVPVESNSHAIVRWALEDAPPETSEVPSDIAAYYGAVRNCIANTPPPGPDDLARVTRPTIITIDFAHGAVSNASVQASSGNTALDQRALICILGAPKETTQSVPDAQNVIAPVAWKPPDKP